MISIIVPVYNVEPFLHQCIDSILCQTHQDIEVLLIDDGSSDKCGEICDEYARVDRRIRVFHTENRGLSVARNLGLQNARGKYLGFVDSDDWIEPDMYEFLLERLEGANADISVCEVWQEYKEGQQIFNNVQNIIYSGIDAIPPLINGRLYNSVWNKLYRRRIWENIGFPEDRNYEDVATLYKVVLNARSVTCGNKLLYHYRKRTKSVSHDYSLKNAVDCWGAFYSRYLHLVAMPEIKNNKECIDAMKKRIAESSVDVWKRACSIPKEQRDYAYLRRISCFEHKNFPSLGEKNWGLSLRINSCFSRYTNDYSFISLYILSKCYRFMKRAVSLRSPSPLSLYS